MLAYMSDLDFMSVSMLPHAGAITAESSMSMVPASTTPCGSTGRFGPTSGCYS